MERTNFWKHLHEGAKRNIPEHYEQMQNNLLWARHFAPCNNTDNGLDGSVGMLNHEKMWAKHHMDAIESMTKYVDGDTPQRVKDIIAEARATYDEIMKLN